MFIALFILVVGFTVVPFIINSMVMYLEDVRPSRVIAGAVVSVVVMSVTRSSCSTAPASGCGRPA